MFFIKIKSRNHVFMILSVSLIISLLSTPSIVFAKSHRPITDTEVKLKKQDCYADIDRSSPIERENCVLKCLSPPCFELIYEGDPLEEGEKDYIRSQEYKYCMHRLSLGESLEGVRGAFDY